jgi:hypothetical protein
MNNQKWHSHKLECNSALKRMRGWKCDLVVWHLTSMQEALGLLLSTAKKEEKK